MAEWIDRMRGVDVAPVAAALGHAVKPAGSAITVSPCPACKAERRHERRGDKRGAIGIRRRIPAGWKCHVCEVTGDALHFVALSLCGRKLGGLDANDTARVREWCLDYAGGRVERRSFTPQAPAPPSYAPPDELRALWDSAIPVRESAAVSRWLEDERGIASEILTSIARVLEHDDAPEWARFRDGTPYSARGYRLLVPMFDVEGRARSLIFRRVFASTEGPKSVPPRGFDRSGLVMACPRAIAMLYRGKLTTDRLVIAEGEMAFLAWSLSSAIATLGIVSGSWTPELAARIPDNARVLIATDHDRAGQEYAQKIIHSLRDRAVARRVVLERWKGARAS